MRHELPLKGQVVRDVKSDGRAHVFIGDYELIAEGEFRLTGKRSTLDKLRGAAATSLVADEGGNLALHLADGSRFTVPADAKFESWQVVGPSGFLWVGGPGGVVTTWTPP